MKNTKLSGADIWCADPIEMEKQIIRTFPILNYDRNDDKHDYKNNSHDNFNNDSKTSEIETKRQRNIFEVLAFYFQR